MSEQNRLKARGISLSLVVVFMSGPGLMAAPRERGGGVLEMQRSRSILPQSQRLVSPEPKKSRNLEAVKPPRSGSFYESGTKEAEYEKILDQEIQTLYALSQKGKRSANRGEIWLRLGERYVEKSRIIGLREQAEYDQRLKDFNDGKTKIRPKLNLLTQREYNEKAVQLYEWFIKDFPNDPKVDQALFFLGYNHFELGNTSAGERYYSQIVKSYPDSAYVTESRFALGEYYFENEAWKKALDHYAYVVKVKKARLNTFAAYKAAWCLFRLNQTKLALAALEKVIRQSRMVESGSQNPGGTKTVSRLRLGQEALKDYVPFYSEAGDPEKAEAEFLRLADNEKQAYQMLERLAYIYADNGNRAPAKLLFKRLIARDPMREKAADYQYQIVISYATHDPKEFRKELETWLENFGSQSIWAKQNSGNQKLTTEVARLQETTLRNFVLQHHQAAQASKAAYSQQVASNSYAQYFRYFPDSPKIVEMRFFYAELLFDMEKYEDAAQFYNWVADKDTKGPYHEKSIVNALLALEKTLPTSKEIDAKRGKTLERIPFDPSVQRFEQAALRFLKAFPKSEKSLDIKRRLGVLYYGYNRFDQALEIFGQIVRENPSSENGEIAGNLILDIYKTRDDMVGFTDKGREFLANPGIARSKFGSQVRAMMEKAGYIRAEKVAESGDVLKAAREFESFAESNKTSDLAVAARYKAATNYEKAGDFGASIRMHNLVLLGQSNDPKIKEAQSDSRNALARMYQQTGQMEAAARQFEAYARSKPKDSSAVNAYFNAGVIFDSLGFVADALRCYQAYFDLSSRADRIEVLFIQAELLNRFNQSKKAAEFYQKYTGAKPANAPNVIKSLFVLGEMAAGNNDWPEAKRWFDRVLVTYKNLSSQEKSDTARYAAESKFKLAQPVLKDLAEVKFGTSEKQQGQAAVLVKKYRDSYIEQMKEVIRFDNGPMIVAALASTGQMFESISQLFTRVAVPAGYQPEEAAKYKELIQAQIQGFKNEAKNSYKAAVDKASELDVYSSWRKLAQDGLRSYEGPVVDPSEFASESRTVDWMGL